MAPSAPPLATVDAYYDPASNQAMFGLRYDELALGAERLRLRRRGRAARRDRDDPAGRALARAIAGGSSASGCRGCTVHVGDQRKRRRRAGRAGAPRARAEAGDEPADDREPALLPRREPAIAPAVRARGDTAESRCVVLASARATPRRRRRDPRPRRVPSRRARLVARWLGRAGSGAHDRSTAMPRPSATRCPTVEPSG